MAGKLATRHPNGLYYTDDEINAMYKGCADKREQIKILSQMNLCSEEDIRNALIRSGIDWRSLPRNARTVKAVSNTVKKTKNHADDVKSEPVLENTDNVGNGDTVEVTPLPHIANTHDSDPDNVVTLPHVVDNCDKERASIDDCGIGEYLKEASNAYLVQLQDRMTNICTELQVIEARRTEILNEIESIKKAVEYARMFTSL